MVHHSIMYFHTVLANLSHSFPSVEAWFFVKPTKLERHVRKDFKLIAAAVGLAGLPCGAQAALVTYDFTATATSGSLAGDTASGSLSFNDSLLTVPNTNYAQPGLLTDLSFT